MLNREDRTRRIEAAIERFEKSQRRRQRPFEKLVKDHVDKGNDVHTAFGKAIGDDPEAYGEYLKRQNGGVKDGSESV
jgi:hypothetical protein